MKRNKPGFTLLELIMIISIIGVLAAIAIPKFINIRESAENARVDGNLAALRSAMEIYYSKTALPGYEHLCNAYNGDSHTSNPYRNVTVNSPCFPANYEELESLLTSPPVWGTSTNKACYDSFSGDIVQCQ